MREVGSGVGERVGGGATVGLVDVGGGSVGEAEGLGGRSVGVALGTGVIVIVGEGVSVAVAVALGAGVIVIVGEDVLVGEGVRLATMALRCAWAGVGSGRSSTPPTKAMLTSPPTTIKANKLTSSLC